MTGPLQSKKLLRGAKVYIHFKDEYAKIEHIDVEHPKLNEIIKDKESTYAAGKKGGFFLGLKKPMLERLRKIYKVKSKG
ncbi:hypothetical protein DRJ17_01245 [Candidatus Woesearchaeota archaeon]|nr:MAG: hypothetical protein DRJ17_01245 [Candidatus Woesearchaeota archaeon]